MWLEPIIPPQTATARITAGVRRLFHDLGYVTLEEFDLGNGRRADVAAMNRKGALVLVEVKSRRADLVADRKWRSYLDFCDHFYFAVDQEFPRALLETEAYDPARTGLIIADAHGGHVLREAAVTPLPAARRKAELIRFAFRAAGRAYSPFNGSV